MDCHQIWYLSIFRNVSKKIQVYLNLTRIAGTFNDDRCTFMTISRWIILITTKNIYKIKTLFLFNKFFPGNHSVYVIMRKKMVETDRQATDENSVPLAIERGISLITLTPIKIAQRNLNGSTFFLLHFLHSEVSPLQISLQYHH
jgi:hypothetical protein